MLYAGWGADCGLPGQAGVVLVRLGERGRRQGPADAVHKLRNGCAPQEERQRYWMVNSTDKCNVTADGKVRFRGGDRAVRRPSPRPSPTGRGGFRLSLRAKAVVGFSPLPVGEGWVRVGRHTSITARHAARRATTGMVNGVWRHSTIGCTAGLNPPTYTRA